MALTLNIYLAPVTAVTSGMTTHADQMTVYEDTTEASPAQATTPFNETIGKSDPVPVIEIKGRLAPWEWLSVCLTHSEHTCRSLKIDSGVIKLILVLPSSPIQHPPPPPDHLNRVKIWSCLFLLLRRPTAEETAH